MIFQSQTTCKFLLKMVYSSWPDGVDQASPITCGQCRFSHRIGSFPGLLLGKGKGLINPCLDLVADSYEQRYKAGIRKFAEN